MDEEFSRLIKAGQIKSAAQEFTLTADEAARTALAARFGLPAIALLEGQFTVQHVGAGVIGARLAMRAEVTMTCVVSLEPFAQSLAEVVELRFVPARIVAEEDEEEDLTPESLDGPDEIPFTDDQIDLGAALAEQLALALPPYPRKPDAQLPPEATDDSANPFAALARKFTKDGKPSA